jgi:hypothetical protein
MKLMGSKIIKVNGEINPDFSGKLELSSNIKITSIEKFTHETSTVESIKITSLFEIDYGDLGKVQIEGILFVGAETTKIDEIIKNFDDKKFDTPEQISIMNLIMQKFSIKAFELEEELGLPIHIKLPSLQAKQE